MSSPANKQPEAPTSGSQSSNNSQGQNDGQGNVPPQQPQRPSAFQDLRVYISEDETFTKFNDPSVPKWHTSNILFGDWEDEREVSLDIPTSETKNLIRGSNDDENETDEVIDDVVFFVYLYQRWAYPTDNKRANEYGQVAESNEDEKTE
ncbi:3446_t:CDS:2, partial [Racocetra fulgida]